jgi:hypothetical protein
VGKIDVSGREHAGSHLLARSRGNTCFIAQKEWVTTHQYSLAAT